MNTFLFKKVSGGVKFDKAGGGDLMGVCVFEIVQVDLDDRGQLIVRIRGQRYVIHVDLDQVTIDLTALGGTIVTYGPGTIEADELQEKIMDLFNPFSNLIMP